jgi:hypothetical protein
MVGWSLTSTEPMAVLSMVSASDVARVLKRSIAPNHKFILGRLCLRQPPQGFSKRLRIKPLQGCYPYLNLATDSSRSGLLLE